MGSSLSASLLALLTACIQAEDIASRSRPQIVSGSYNGYSYQLFVPSSYASGRPAPLVLLLHGCLPGRRPTSSPPAA